MQNENATPTAASAQNIPPAVQPRSLNSNRPIATPTSTALARKKTHTTAACDTCRKRKVKCNAARPACGYCVSAGVNCVYRTKSNNETHAQAVKRKISELSSLESTFQQIYEHLRDRPEEETSEIVKRIRAGADPQSILRSIAEGDLLLQLALVPETRYRYVFPMAREMPKFLIRPDNPYLNSKVYEWTTGNASAGQELSVYGRPRPAEPQSPYEKPYHIAELVEPLINTVKPTEWTTVSSDDGLLRKLLALYFVHEYQWFPSFQKDYFLQDMAAGRRSCCSPLLVNIVLAIGCRAYQKLPNRYEYWNPRNLGYQFLAEAKRLWEIETAGSQVRLTTVQAGILLTLAHIMDAMDAIGASYLRKSVAMAQGMGIFTPASSQNQTSRRSRAREFTAWALFNFQSIVSYSLFELPMVQKPPAVPLPNPSKDPNWYGQIWLRYPLDPKFYTTHFPYQFKAQSKARVIMNGNWVRQFSKGDSASTTDSELHQANEFYSQLKDWHDNLPEPLTPARITFPSQLMLHIHYQNVIVLLYGPISTSSPLSPSTPNPAQICAAAARHLETLLRLYYLRHGFAHVDSFLGKPLIQLGFMSLNKIQALTSRNTTLQQITDSTTTTTTTTTEASNDTTIISTTNTATKMDVDLDTTRATLLLAAQGVHEQGKIIYLAQVILRVLCAKMGPEEKALVARVLGDVTSLNPGNGSGNEGSASGSGNGNGNGGGGGTTTQQTVGAGPQIREVRSRLLTSAVSFSGDPEVHRLGNLVSQQLRLDEEGEEGEEGEGEGEDE